MGPTVCELEGPMPMENRSNKLMFIGFQLKKVNPCDYAAAYAIYRTILAYTSKNNYIFCSIGCLK
jgi:hypothetical protein